MYKWHDVIVNSAAKDGGLVVLFHVGAVPSAGEPRDVKLIFPHTTSMLELSADFFEIVYNSVSQTVVRGPQVVLGYCPCGPFRLNISPKMTEK